MEKKWRIYNFICRDDMESFGMNCVVGFINKHALKPEEFRVIPLQTFGWISVIYFADKDLPR